MQNRKFLTVYFSWSGHTRKAAEKIAAVTEGRLFEITPEEPYSKLYHACLIRAKKEHDSDARPAFTGSIEEISQYSDIVIGYPVWWYTCPQIILSFLEKYDLAGKNVYLFNTHVHTGAVGTDDVKRVCRGNVHDSIVGNHLTEDSIREWLGL